MNAVALSPHNDDVELFAAAQLCRYQPDVVVVFRSELQEQRGTGITSRQREAETAAAMEVFGLRWMQWEFSDCWDLPAAGLFDIAQLPEHYDLCIAPAVEDGGHEQHNQVGAAALAAFGEERIVRYLTYRRGHGRSVGAPAPLGDACLALKRAALACYETQIAEPSTAPWFLEPGSAEWLA